MIDQQQKIPNSTAALVLAVVSIFSACCCYGILGLIFAVIAFYLAKNGLELYNQKQEYFTNSSYKNVKLAKTLSVIGIVVGSIMLIISAIFIAKFGFEALSDPEALQEIIEEMQNN